VPGLELLPWPREVRISGGELQLGSATFHGEFPGAASERLRRAVDRLSARTAARSGDDLAGNATRIRLDVEVEGEAFPGFFEDESYTLEVSSRRIAVQAVSEWGALRALATLAQLVTPDLHIPCVVIRDAPRFPWRGLHLDPARRFLAPEDLTRTLDGMEACKLNVLHLHLSDDQGFRFPSFGFPELASDPAYTRDALEEVIQEAADRGIRVVPELDMPGHVTSWLAQHPEWGCRPVEPSRRFGVHAACLDPTSDAVYAAVETLLGEICEVFPDPCVHIGGDEVHPSWWAQDEKIQAYMKAHGMTTPADLQAAFSLRVAGFVGDLGRTVVAWDEVLHERLPRDWIVQAWRGATARDRFLARGNRVVLSAPYYLDLNYPADVHYGFDPGASQAELLAGEEALEADPRMAHVRAGMQWTHQWRSGAVALSEVPTERILGGEACLWGELVDGSVLDTRLWTRLPAVAERFWSASDCPAAGTLYPRLERFRTGSLMPVGIDIEATVARQLESLGVDAGWQTLARLLEPVKWYGRLLGEEALAARLAGTEMPQARPYDADSPLTGLADFLPPEALIWRSLDALVADGEPDPAARQQLREQLDGWQAVVLRSGVPQPLTPFVPLLARLMMLVERRLDGEPAAADVLDELKKPRGELMLAVGPALTAWLTGTR